MSHILLRFILIHFLRKIAETFPDFFMDHSFIIVSVLWDNYIKSYLVDVEEKK